MASASVAETLELRFTKFLKDFPGSEWLDAAEFRFPPKVRKADFLLRHRTIIVEIKTITDDQQPRVDNSIAQYLKTTGIKVWGTVVSTQLFNDPNESDKFHRRLLRGITRNTEEMCRSANNQIAQTSQHLGIDSTGVLVILNEDITVLDPGIVAHRICEYLDNKPRNIDYCLLIFESHEVVNEGRIHNQMLLIHGCRKASHLADDFMDQLMRQWAEHNGSEYISRDTFDPTSIDYRPSISSEK